jgi:hypothetical protein
MLTPEYIDEIRQHTGVSTIDAIHALAMADGNVQRAIGDLNNHLRSGNRAIIAATKESAQRIAAALIDAGLWFECEVTAAAQWRFSVALGAYGKLLELSSAANCDATAGSETTG